MRKTGFWRMTACMLTMIMAILALPVRTLAWNGAVAQANPQQEGVIEYLDAFGNKHRAAQDLLAKERQTLARLIIT